MAAKFFVFSCMLAAATALVIPASPYSKVAYEEPSAPALYSFEYSVQDQHTGDSKKHHEVRNGGNVQGSYSLVQPDGTVRIVDYTADDHHGFNAVVRVEGQKVAYSSAPVAKIAYAQAPVAKIAYQSAPLTKIAYAQPQLAYAAPSQVAYAAPAHGTYAAPGQVTYAAPSQVTYAALGQVTYAAPIAKHAYQPALSKLAYTQNLGHVSYSSPIVSYHH